MNGRIKNLLLTSRRYRFYKMMQRMSNIYYSKLMVMMIMILSILSNTLFSLGYILLLSCVMFFSKLFYDVDSARTTLLPLLKKFVIPYMHFEIMLQLIYQIPVINQAFDSEDHQLLKLIPKVLGVEKYYNLRLDDNIPTLTEETDFKSLGQLWCKAVAYFFISL